MPLTASDCYYKHTHTHTHYTTRLATPQNLWSIIERSNESGRCTNKVFFWDKPMSFYLKVPLYTDKMNSNNTGNTAGSLERERERERDVQTFIIESFTTFGLVFMEL